MNKDDRTYFLGTIVLAHDEQGNLLVADGQQRLATTSILIAAIRDYLYGTDNESDKKSADKYTHKYLLEYDEEHDDDSPKLYLNAMDRDFFSKAILAPPAISRGTTQSQSTRPTVGYCVLPSYRGNILRKSYRIYPKVKERNGYFNGLSFLRVKCW